MSTEVAPVLPVDEPLAVPEAKPSTTWQKMVYWHQNSWNGINLPKLAVLIVLLLALWWIPPSDLPAETWHVFVTFLVTIVAAVIEPLPISGICLVALGFCTATNVLSTSQVLSGFGNDTVWLIVFAFFIASGFVSSGLGKRICFIILKYIGSTTLGLGYAFCLCEFILATAIPSSTARAAGILLPIIEPLMKEGFASDPELGTRRRIGTYLVLVEMVANTTSSVCWLTGGAWNAMMASFMADVGVNISWGEWAYSMAPVGVLPLLYAPVLIYFLYPPEVKKTPEAPKLAMKKLKEMGSVSKQEIVMLIVFIGVIVLWILSSTFDSIPYSTAGVAMMGVSVLLMVGVIDVKRDIIQNAAAWDLFLWFGVLLMLATQLKETGFFEWFASKIDLSSVSPYWALVITCSLFYVTQYAFASITAHVSAMFPVFLQIMQSAGVPMELGCRALAWTTLSGHLTHYTSSSNPPYYAMHYVTLKEWGLQGLLIMAVNLVVLFTVGFGYWSLLGFW